MASCEVIGFRYSTSKEEFAVAGRLPSEYETWPVEGVGFFSSFAGGEARGKTWEG